MSIPPIHDSAVVTTALSGGPELRARALATAEAVGLPVMRRRSLPDGIAALVVEAEGAHLQLPGDVVVRSHPGMGLVRVRRLVRGEERDPIVDVGELRAGDRVLDATFGYGQDTLVAAYAVGPTGSVLGIEASPLLAGLALAGRAQWPKPAAQIMERVEIRWGDMRETLRNSAPGSFDVVFIDPMFRRPKPAAPDFRALRSLAELSPLTEEDVAMARRIARRWVVVKDGWPGLDLKRLGIPALPFRRSAEIVWGRVPGDYPTAG